jgi:hypothetical protein
MVGRWCLSGVSVSVCSFASAGIHRRRRESARESESESERERESERASERATERERERERARERERDVTAQPGLTRTHGHPQTAEHNGLIWPSFEPRKTHMCKVSFYMQDTAPSRALAPSLLRAGQGVSARSGSITRAQLSTPPLRRRPSSQV